MFSPAECGRWRTAVVCWWFAWSLSCERVRPEPCRKERGSGLRLWWASSPTAETEGPGREMDRENKSRIRMMTQNEFTPWIYSLILTFIPLLFWTTCHICASTLLWGAGGCWGCREGLRGVTAKAPIVFRLWSGAHTQFIITWGRDQSMKPRGLNHFMRKMSFFTFLPKLILQRSQLKQWYSKNQSLRSTCLN